MSSALGVDATFDLGSSSGERSVSAAEFWTGYRETAQNLCRIAG